MSAIPHSQFRPASEDFAINSLERRKSIWEKTIDNYKCARNIIGNIIKEGDLKANYEQLKKATNPLLGDDVEACNAIDGEQDKKEYVPRNILL